MNYTEFDQKNQEQGSNKGVGFCVKCNELYNIPYQLLDVIFPICPQCYIIYFINVPDAEASSRKESYQSNFPPCEKSLSCQNQNPKSSLSV